MSQAAAIDTLVSVGGRISYSCKIIVEDVYAGLFNDFVQDALLQYSRVTLPPDTSSADEEEDPFKAESLRLLRQITSIKCKGAETTELLEFLHMSNATLGLLNSKTTPFVRNGLIIVISPPKPTNPQPPKPRVNAFSIMLGTSEPATVSYIDPPPIESNPQLNVQIKSGIVLYLKDEIGLGYYNQDQKECLQNAILFLTNTLCFLQKQWNKFFARDFPAIPRSYLCSELLSIAARCNRTSKKSKSTRLEIGLVSTHIEKLASIHWTAYRKVKRMQHALSQFKDEVATIIGLLEGFGQVFYTLRDSVFDPSRVFDHTSQLIYSLEKENLNPFVLVLQTDGGPDHSIKFLNTKMALLALFLKMNLDHLLVLRGAPNGSAYNKIERAMSPANAALSNVSIKRVDMPEWAENM